MAEYPERLSGGAMDLSHLAAPSAGSAPQPGGGGQVIDVPSLVVDVTDQTFEQVAQLSNAVPVVIDLWAEWCQPCKTLGPVLEKLALELDGRILLAKVDVDANPGLAQAFQAQSIPTVVALIGGRPVPLFQGAMPEAQVRDVLEQLVQLGEQQGLRGRLSVPGGGEAGEEASTEPAVNPAHVEALEALGQGDLEGAIRAYEAVLLKAPADHEAHTALLQVKLLHRLQPHDAVDIRAAAASGPDDLDAQLLVADLDVSGGHVEDAFSRLLDCFAAATEDREKTAIRERLVEFFEVVGLADPRVIRARGRLANLLY